MILPGTPLVRRLDKRQTRRAAIACAAVDALEARVMLTGTLTPIATFNGVDGYAPTSEVADANGNIFGATLATTSDGGNTFGPGVIFEIPAGTGTIRDLVTLTASGSVGTVDSSGDVFGVEAGATASVPDTVFEIPAGTSTLTPLATFAPQFGTQGTVTAVDSAGDVFGAGPWEIVKGSGVMTPVENPNGPQVPIAPQLGPDGNLYGIGNDQNGNSVIAEVSPTTGNVTILATIDPNAIGTFPQGIAIDSSGNIWGLCQEGGSAGVGSVFELPAGSNTVSLIASFTAATGDTPVGPPVFDASGNLYGLTSNDGANGDGSVFQIAASSISAAAADARNRGPASPLTNSKTGDPADVSPIGLAPLALTNSDDVSAGGGIVTQYPGNIAAGIGDTIIIFFSLGGKPTMPGQTVAFGQEAKVQITIQPGTDPIVVQKLKELQNRLNNELDAQQEALDALKGLAGAKIERAGSVPAAITQDVGTSMFSRRALVSADAEARPLVKLSAPLEQITKMLATAGRDLKSASALVKKDTAVTAQYAKEGNTITALEAQLAAQTNASAEAKIQKKINADTSLQNKFANQCTGFYNTGTTELNNITTLETNIQTALNALET